MRVGSDASCNTSFTLEPAVLTSESPLGSYIIPTYQHESFVRTLSSLLCTQEDFPIGHPSQDFSRPRTLNLEVLLRQLPRKKMHLVGMSTLLILLTLGPGYHHPPGPGYHKRSTFDLIGCLDVDIVRCKVDRKSTSGTC
jgi:hypothetical protein